MYHGKLAKRYGHAPTDECPLCHIPYSCTQIAGECPHHKALTNSRHNAACQLVHAAIQNSAKGGGPSQIAGLSPHHGGRWHTPSNNPTITGDSLSNTI